MQGKIKYFVMSVLVCMICIGYGQVVQGHTGSGSASSPYIVTNEADIREVLTTKGTDSWKYVAVNSDITLKKSIVISKGKFRIYAKGSERRLMRSDTSSDPINSNGNPKFCIVVKGNADVVFGYKEGSSHVLRLGGNKGNFTGNKKSSGFVYVGSNASVTIDKNTLLTNVKNNKNNEGGTAIFSMGNLIINGEISNCEGTDGGAIGLKDGKLLINNTAYIHNCSSATEGGGVFGIINCNIEMAGGTISNCSAQEEGGGIFVGGESVCKISAGTISNNSSNLSGGGIFTGMGAAITVGKTDGTGPLISNNKAATYGGGIRCNGGTNSNKGGISLFYGGTISGNYAGKSGGGISCGPKGNKFTSKIYLKSMQIINNSSKEGIGGGHIPAGTEGVGSSDIFITNCAFRNNKTEGYCGGLMTDGVVVATNCTFTGNESKKYGGAIFINSGILQLSSSDIRSNTSSTMGSGVYAAGILRMRDTSYVDENNEVYLTRGVYIEVIGKLSKTSGLIAKINSEVNTNGTKLVRASYSGSTATGELYYSDAKKSERYRCISMSNKQLLRPSEKVNGYENVWIIISEKYSIQYQKNTTDKVENMPDSQDKYWNEDITLSKNQITRGGYVLEEKKHWNSKADGSGKVYAPGTYYRNNSNLVLYGIWKRVGIKEIYINTVDRYYALNQKIVLDKKEVLKKVTTDDDLHTGKKYELKVTGIDKINHSNFAKGDNIATEEYMNTSEVTQYIITVEAEDGESKVKTSANMYVYVLSADLSNGQVRFISYEYMNTLDNTSKWNKGLRYELITSLREEEKSVYKINISKVEINEIKDDIKKNNYKINNQMNKNVVGKLEI